MKMITNYLSNLESYLPDEMKQEVREELEASIYGQIEDQKEQLGRDPNEHEQAELLSNIGHPMRVASSYLPDQQLISADFFPAYKDSLKKALIFFIVVKILIMTPGAFSGDLSVASIIGNIFSLADTALFVFGLTTLIFFLMNKYDAKGCLKTIYSWSPQELKSKQTRLPLKRPEILFEMMFQLLFIAWWNDAISIPATLANTDVSSQISLSQEWSSVFLIVNIIFACDLLLNLHKLVVSGWQKLTLVANICLGLVSLGVLFQISQFDSYVYIGEALINDGKWQRLINFINPNILIILAFIALANVWDIYSSSKRLRNR